MRNRISQTNMSGMRAHRRSHGYVDLVQTIRDDHIAISPSAVPPCHQMGQHSPTVIVALLQRQRVEIGRGAAATTHRGVPLEHWVHSGPFGPRGNYNPTRRSQAEPANSGRDNRLWRSRNCASSRRNSVELIAE